MSIWQKNLAIRRLPVCSLQTISVVLKYGLKISSISITQEHHTYAILRPQDKGKKSNSRAGVGKAWTMGSIRPEKSFDLAMPRQQKVGVEIQ